MWFKHLETDEGQCECLQNAMNVAGAMKSVEGTTVMTGKESESNRAVLPEKEEETTCVSAASKGLVVSEISKVQRKGNQRRAFQPIRAYTSLSHHPYYGTNKSAVIFHQRV